MATEHRSVTPVSLKRKLYSVGRNPVLSKRTSDIFFKLIPHCLAVRLGRAVFFSEVVSSQANWRLDYLGGLS